MIRYLELSKKGIHTNDLLQEAGYVPSRNRRDEPIYYGQDSRTRLLNSQSAKSVTSEQVITKS